MIILDDDFTTHPKVLAAGPVAGWLYVAGLAYASKHLTGGRIPKTAVRMLLPARNATQTAHKLCSVGLWHDDGNVYRIHDYEGYNAKQAARREKARQAARSRWDSHAPSNAPSNANASSEHMPHDADAMPENKELRTKNSSSSNAVTHEPRRDRLDDDDERASLAEKLAKRDLERRIRECGPVAHPEAWLYRAIARHFDKPLDQMRAELASPQLAAAASIAVASIRDIEQARQRALDQAAKCPTCDTGGWIYNDDGTVRRCNHRAPA